MSASWRAALVAILAGVALAGCGGGGMRSALALRAELDARGLGAARTAAPDLVAEAGSALDEAAAAERAGDAIAAADHRARASLLAETAFAEAERLELDEARREEERAVIAAEDELVALDASSSTARDEAARLASARAAREELRRALARAADEEASRRRSRRLSLDDARELRVLGAALRDRARLLLAAAAALGASDEARGAATALLAESEGEESDLVRALTLADEAHDAARTALGAARRARGGATPEAARSLAEAAEADGFLAVALERGMAIELEGLFASGSTSLTAAARARLERLAALLSGYPDGPIRVEIDVATGGDSVLRTVRARGDAVVAALVAAGVAAERLSRAEAPVLTAASAEPADRARVILVAYVDVAPTSAPPESAMPADGGSAAPPEADPTPAD